MGGASWSARGRLVGAAAAFLTAFAALLVLVEVRWTPLHRADLSTSDYLHGYARAHHGFVVTLQVLSDIGSGWTATGVFAVVAAWLLWRRRIRLAAFAIATAVLSSPLNWLVKEAVRRLRPTFLDPVAHAPGFSFPSGHAQSAVVTVGILLVVFLPRVPSPARPVLVATAALWIAAIGLARIGLGVHYLSDVLAGYALGAAWLALMVAAFRPVTPPAR